MRRARYDLERLLAAEPFERLAIQFEHMSIFAADDQQRRRLHALERVAGQVGPTATGDDRAGLGTLRGGDEGGGRPDLAGDALPRVRAPTLLIVGGEDTHVLELNREALERLGGAKALEVVPGATHLFEEPGALDEVARLARDWFTRWLQP